MQGFIARLGETLDPAGLLTNPAEMAPYLTDWRHVCTGEAVAVLRPGSTEQVAKAVRICAEHDVRIVPQGGNTGLAGGATPTGIGPQVVLALARMNRIREIDRTGLVAEVEAGVILQTLREEVAKKGRLLPVSLASQGSAMVGGIIATNAGGVNVLRYGMTRDFVLGLEVVLADGTVIGGPKRLRKDNAGYDWKQLFIGSEGAFGIVTAASLRLVPAPRYRTVALVTVADVGAAIDLMDLFLDRIGETLTAFEMISGRSMRLVDEKLGMQAPMSNGQWYLLIEVSSSLAGLREETEATLASGLETGLILDGTLAATELQADAIWALRENITEAEARAGKSLKHDISLPLARIAGFLDLFETQLADLAPSTRSNVFGHLGDGNLHVNVTLEGSELPDLKAAITAMVHDLAFDVGGSISAEHGFGQLRLDEYRRLAPKAEQDLLSDLKSVVDPARRLNPGKAIPFDC